MNNQNLVPKKITDKNGKQTTVYTRPEGKSWATGSKPAAPASRAAVVSSAPTPPKPFTALAGLAHGGIDNTTIPEGEDAQWEAFFRRAHEGEHFPLDSWEDENDGATVTHEWHLNADGDGVVIHVKRELNTRWDASPAMERLWAYGVAGDLHLEVVKDEFGNEKYIGGGAFESFVEKSVDGINRKLWQYDFDASRVQYYDEAGLETSDVVDIMRAVGLNPDDPRVEIDADDIWNRIGFKNSVTSEQIDREQFIAYLRDKNLYDGD